MSTTSENITTEVRSSRAARTPKAVNRELPKDSIIKTIKSYFTKHKLAKQWGYRNLYHGDVFVETLEVPSIVFQQNLFIEETKSIYEKLIRLGFAEQQIFPDCEHYQLFCTTYYQAKHNLAVCLFSSSMKEHINTAQLISTKTTADPQSGLAIFLNTLNVLVTKA